MSGIPTFSVIIPTYNRPRSLRACLQALIQQSYSKSELEIVVVDDGSIPPIGDTLQTEFPGAIASLIRSPQNEGPASARNRGAEQARGKYFAFIDDDCLPDRNWLSKLELKLGTSPHIAVGGGIISGGQDMFSAASHVILVRAYRYYNESGGAPRFFASLNLAVPACGFREIGGFDPAFRTSEDREFCTRWIRRGNGLAFAPEASVVHSYAPGFRAFLYRHYSYGKGAYRYRSMEARNRGERVKLESPAFYMRLIHPSKATQSDPGSAGIFVLTVVAQAASLLGFMAERRLMKSGR